jgi:hypothetical protein
MPRLPTPSVWGGSIYGSDDAHVADVENVAFALQALDSVLPIVVQA